MKRILSAAAAVLILFCSCGKKTGDPSDILTMEQLASRNGGTAPEITYHNDGSIREIRGRLSAGPVYNEDGAYDVIYSLSGILGIDDPENELVFDKVSRGRVSKKYTFAQYYQGIPVYGGAVSVMAAGSSGYVDSLSSSYVKVGSVITEPSVKKEEAVRLISEHTQESLASAPELYIRGDRLFWVVSTSEEPPVQYFINAFNGEVTK